MTTHHDNNNGMCRSSNQLPPLVVVGYGWARAGFRFPSPHRPLPFQARFSPRMAIAPWDYWQALFCLSTLHHAPAVT